jgi:T5SS/PEP-CTERM-associated repeat protein
MPRLPLLPRRNAWRVGSRSLILALVVAARLPAATVLTGDVTPALPWSLTTSVSIGSTSAGTLAVDDGSVLSSLDATLGADPGATGTATVAGAGTTWINNSRLDLGNSGSGSLRAPSRMVGVRSRDIGESWKKKTVGRGHPSLTHTRHENL